MDVRISFQISKVMPFIERRTDQSIFNWNINATNVTRLFVVKNNLKQHLKEVHSIDETHDLKKVTVSIFPHSFQTKE